MRSTGSPRPKPGRTSSLTEIIRPKAFPPHEISIAKTEPVIGQHADEAAFLWQIRDAAVRAPQYKLAHLEKLDKRLEAHLDGLRFAHDLGWAQLSNAVEVNARGAVFAAGVLAFESGQEGMIEWTLEAGLVSPEVSRELISALGWLPIEKASQPIKGLLNSDQPARKCVGIAGAAAHRKLPTGSVLPDALGSDNPILMARALRVVGELGLIDFHLATRSRLRSKDPTVRYWAAWSNALLDGHKDALACLQNIAEGGGPLAERAAQMVIRRLAPSDAKSWIKKLAKDLGKKRIAIIAGGAFADPDVVPFLIDQMKDPMLAKVAGESFSLITGAKIAYEDLDGEPPEGDKPPPTAGPEEEAASSADLSLPRPNPVLIQKWWSARQGKFAKGTRYSLGKPITVESLREALKTGYQRQRPRLRSSLRSSNRGVPYSKSAPSLAPAEFALIQ